MTPPIYEQDSDRQRQYSAAQTLQAFFNKLPIGRVEVKETPRAQRASHDMNVYVSGMYVGVIELKSRKQTEEWFHGQGTILCEVDRLRRLKGAFYNARKGFWSKDVFMAWQTGDDVLFLMDIREIARQWEGLEDAAAKMLTDDHGAKPARKTGKLIPVDLLTRIP